MTALLSVRVDAAGHMVFEGAGISEVVSAHEAVIEHPSGKLHIYAIDNKLLVGFPRGEDELRPSIHISTVYHRNAGTGFQPEVLIAVDGRAYLSV